MPRPSNDKRTYDGYYRLFTKAKSRLQLKHGGTWVDKMEDADGTERKVSYLLGEVDEVNNGDKKDG